VAPDFAVKSGAFNYTFPREATRNTFTQREVICALSRVVADTTDAETPQNSLGFSSLIEAAYAGKGFEYAKAPNAVRTKSENDASVATSKLRAKSENISIGNRPL
jgi:hypothetical protein